MTLRRLRQRRHGCDAGAGGQGRGAQRDSEMVHVADHGKRSRIRKLPADVHRVNGTRPQKMRKKKPREETRPGLEMRTFDEGKEVR